MKTVGSLTITTPTDREIAMSRVFDAPRHLVFDAYTRPELVQRWLGVFGGWYEGDAVGTVTFVEKAGRTTLTITMLYASKAVRDAVLASPMEQGVGASFDRLEGVLATSA